MHPGSEQATPFQGEPYHKSIHTHLQFTHRPLLRTSLWSFGKAIMPALSLVVAVPTFICSLLSLMASCVFALFYILYPPERHFRQALVVNLLLAGEC